MAHYKHYSQCQYSTFIELTIVKPLLLCMLVKQEKKSFHSPAKTVERTCRQYSTNLVIPSYMLNGISNIAVATLIKYVYVDVTVRNISIQMYFNVKIPVMHNKSAKNGWILRFCFRNEYFYFKTQFSSNII